MPNSIDNLSSLSSLIRLDHPSPAENTLAPPLPLIQILNTAQTLNPGATLPSAESALQATRHPPLPPPTYLLLPAGNFQLSHAITAIIPQTVGSRKIQQKPLANGVQHAIPAIPPRSRASMLIKQVKKPNGNLLRSRRNQQVAAEKIKKKASNACHFAEKISSEMINLHKITLQSLVGKTQPGEVDKALLKQAIKHLLLVEPPTRRAELMAKIANSQTMSTADKEKCQQLIQSHQATPSSFNEVAKINLSQVKSLNIDQLQRGLNGDLIDLLVANGATIQQLCTFNFVTTLAAEIVKRELLGQCEDKINQVINSTSVRNKIYAIKQLFNTALKKIAPWIDPLIYVEKEMEEKTLKNLEANFIRCATLLDLFKQTSHNNLLVMERSVLNNAQLHLLTTGDNPTPLTYSQFYEYGNRSEDLLRHLHIAPFIFGDNEQRAVINSDDCSYGCRGLPFKKIHGWINNPAISSQQLGYIGLYCNSRLHEITTTGDVDIGWMQELYDSTLARLFAPRADPLHPTSSAHPFVLINALKEIGKVLIDRHFDHKNIGELLALVRKRINYQADTNHLACLLFDADPADPLSLTGIAANIMRAQIDSNFSYPAEKVNEDFGQLINRFINHDVLRKMRLPEDVKRQTNIPSLKQELLQFVAQRYAIPIIQEDSEGLFKRCYDIAGRIQLTAPAACDESIILRPRGIIPVDLSGMPQPTIDLRYENNHTLLTELVNYLEQQKGWQFTANQLETLIFSLESEFLAQCSLSPEHENNR